MISELMTSPRQSGGHIRGGGPWRSAPALGGDGGGREAGVGTAGDGSGAVTRRQARIMSFCL